MTWREFVLMREGYLRKKSYEAAHFRAICYTIYCTVTPIEKRKSVEEYWPLPTDEMSDFDQTAEAERLRDILEKFKKGELYK